jgi:hypothetical protein
MKAAAHVQQLEPAAARFGVDVPDEPDRLYNEMFVGSRRGGAGLVRDLRDLYLLASDIEITWTLLCLAAAAKQDAALVTVASTCEQETAVQVKWLKTRMKAAAPQAMLVDPPKADAARETLKAKLKTGSMFRPGSGVYTFGASLIALALIGAIGESVHRPMLFPSLGPIVLLFFDTPLTPRSRPRNTMIANIGGLAFGYLSLVLFGLRAAPPVTVQGITAARIAAAALSVALTGLLAASLKAQHPPAGATTLIVSLGILHRPDQLVVMAIAIALITAVGWLLNRAVGVRMPIWSATTDLTAAPE